MEDILLQVDESWTQPASFAFVNIPNHHEFVKTDHEGNPLAGVKFMLEDGRGNTVLMAIGMRNVRPPKDIDLPGIVG